jgi:hypothetical protein
MPARRFVGRVLCVSAFLRVPDFLSVLSVSAVSAFAFDSISNLKFPISNRFSVHLWFQGFTALVLG